MMTLMKTCDYNKPPEHSAKLQLTVHWLFVSHVSHSPDLGFEREVECGSKPVYIPMPRTHTASVQLPPFKHRRWQTARQTESIVYLSENINREEKKINHGVLKSSCTSISQ